MLFSKNILKLPVSNSGGMEVRVSKYDFGNFVYVTDLGVHLLLILLYFCIYINSTV